MSKSIALKVLCAALFLVIIGLAPQSVLAQRGGHGGGGFHGGGGGGFHGGGGGFHGGGVAYHGGAVGGWHAGSGWHGGGGYYAGGHYHGGYYGHGGYWGYPGYGYGFGLSIGFNWGPFWGGYGYPYGYAWAPSYYPYYVPYPYPYPYYVPASPAGYADSSDPNSNTYAYASAETSDYAPETSSMQQYSAAPQEYRAPATNSMTIRNASYASPPPHYAHPVATQPNSYRPATSTARQLPAMRPEVQNVIRALQGMPPAARQRQLDSGRYSNLTPQELRFVRYAANVPPA